MLRVRQSRRANFHNFWNRQKFSFRSNTKAGFSRLTSLLPLLLQFVNLERIQQDPFIRVEALTTLKGNLGRDVHRNLSISGHSYALAARVELCKESRVLTNKLTQTKFEEPRVQLKDCYERAFALLHCAQHCSSRMDTIVLGKGGGFGSMFQFAARQFLDSHIKGLQEDKPIRTIFKGDFKWYTKNAGCHKKAYQCFFEAEGRVRTNTRYCINKCSPSATQVSFDVFWWGVFQAYMFRPNKNLLGAANKLRFQHKFEGYPDIALHIRYGDKMNDLKSRQDVEISPQTYLRLAEHWSRLLFELTGEKAVVFVATDSQHVEKQVANWAVSNIRIAQVVTQSGTFAQKGKKYNQQKSEAAKLGMKLSGRAKFREAERFLLDLHFMMHAKFFGGLCMSQPARIVVNIGYVKGTLMQAVALDEQNIELTDRWKLGSTEGWSRVSDVLPSKL